MAGNLFEELKRRKVFKAGAAYLVVAWLAVQAASIGFPAFDAPPWALRVFILVSLLGFPLVLVMAWVFDATPEGMRRDADSPGGKRVFATAAVLVVLALGWYFYGQPAFRKGDAATPTAATTTAAAPGATAAAAQATATTDGRASIAVLPFVNMSTDAENGFFADGISEELLNVLAGVDGLKVASRTSAFSFKGKNTPIPEIARQLGVQHVLEGSVRKQGQRVRITAQLIHAGSDGHLWSETYDRDLDDIFKVQEEIAQAITSELQGLLGKRDVAVAASTKDLDAYQDFLRGRARFHQRGDMLAATADLSRAVKRDPAFAEAWVYLAAAWHVAPGYHLEAELAAKDAAAAARTALARAATLAPKHPMVLALQGQFRGTEDLVGTLALLEEAAALSQQDSTPMAWRGQFLLRNGYVEDAVAVLEKAQAMDPLAGVNNGYLAVAMLSTGEYAKAEALARRALAQGWNPAIRIVVLDLAARGERQRAVEIFDEFLAGPPGTRLSPQAATVRAMLLDPRSVEPGDLPGAGTADFNAELCIALQDFDPLFDYAERAQARGTPDDERQWWPRSAWMPSTLALREDPRFFTLATEWGMVRLWEARGYPVGCKRVRGAGGDRLDCPAR